MVGLPTRRPPTHPGEVLLEEFLKPLGLTQVELARRLGIPFQRVNQIVRRRREVTPDTALRLARFFGTTPDLWLGLQKDWNLWHAMRAPAAKKIRKIMPLAAAATQASGDGKGARAHSR